MCRYRRLQLSQAIAMYGDKYIINKIDVQLRRLMRSSLYTRYIRVPGVYGHRRGMKLGERMST